MTVRSDPTPLNPDFITVIDPKLGETSPLDFTTVIHPTLGEPHKPRFFLQQLTLHSETPPPTNPEFTTVIDPTLVPPPPESRIYYIKLHVPYTRRAPPP